MPNSYIGLQRVRPRFPDQWPTFPDRWSDFSDERPGFAAERPDFPAAHSGQSARTHTLAFEGKEDSIGFRGVVSFLEPRLETDQVIKDGKKNRPLGQPFAWVGGGPKLLQNDTQTALTKGEKRAS